MATNATFPINTFITSNMKPENGNQVDSLWGQNVVDNIMYIENYNQNVLTLGPSVFQDASGGGEISGTFYIHHDYKKGTLCGTYSVYGSALNTGNQAFIKWDNGTIIYADVSFNNVDLTSGFRQTVGHLPVGSHNKPIPFIVSLKGTGASGVIKLNSITAWLEV